MDQVLLDRLRRNINTTRGVKQERGDSRAIIDRVSLDLPETTSTLNTTHEINRFKPKDGNTFTISITKITLQYG